MFSKDGKAQSSKAGVRRVLVVDDDPIQCEFAALNLAKPDLEIVTKRSVREAIRELSHSNYDLLVTDYDMPNQNGHDLIEAVRAMGLKFPIILVTGVEDLPIINAAYRLGATTFLLKPVDWTTLSAQIRNALSNADTQR